MSRKFLASVTTLAIAGLAGACGGGSDLVLPDEGVPSSIVVLHGDQQSAAVGAALPDSVVVRVTDTKGRPVLGQQVVFAVSAAGGNVSPDTVSTNANGQAAVRWILGAAAGPQTLTARVIGPNVPNNLSATASAAASPGGAAAIAPVQGDNQTATAGSLLADSLVVRVTDANGNPVAGIDVTWATTGGGSVSATTVATGADGRAGVLRTLGAAAGPQTTTASAGSITGSPVTFAATATVGAAGRLTITTPPSSSAASGTPFPQQPRLQLRDANGNTVKTAGVAVTATIASGPGGTLVGSSTVPTDANGLATFSGLGISGPGGTYTLNFGGAGLSGVSSGPIAIGAGSVAQLSITRQPSSSVQSGQELAQQPVIQLLDANGNTVAIAGVAVTATIASGGGTLGGTATVTTDASGRATFTNLSISGSAGTRTLAFFAGSAVVTSTAIQVTAPPPPPPQTVSASRSTVAASPGTITAGGGASTITVTALDADGAPVAGAAVTLNVTGSEITVSSPAVTDANGRTTATLSSTAAGVKTVTATAGGVTITSTATVTVTAGAPSASASTISASPTTVAPLEPSTITVTVVDANGNPVQGATVTLASEGGIATLPGITNASGVTTGSITWLTSGTKTVTATVNGTVLLTHTATVTVQAAAQTVSASRSTVTADPGTITAGTTSNITVTARDDGGGTIAGATVTLTASGSDNTVTPTTATTDANGVATFTFSSTTAETKVLTAQIGGVTIDQTATVVVEAAAASPGTTSAVVPNGKRGQTTVFTVTAFDEFGNRLTTSAGTVTASIDGKNAGAPVSITDNQNGTYTGRYTPSSPGNGGTDVVSIFLNGTAISGSPYTSILSGS